MFSGLHFGIAQSLWRLAIPRGRECKPRIQEEKEKERGKMVLVLEVLNHHGLALCNQVSRKWGCFLTKRRIGGTKVDLSAYDSMRRFPNYTNSLWWDVIVRIAMWIVICFLIPFCKNAQWGGRMRSLKEKEFFHFDFYSSYNSTPLLKLEITIIVIHKCSPNEIIPKLFQQPNCMWIWKCPM